MRQQTGSSVPDSPGQRRVCGPKILRGSCWGAVLGSAGPLCSDQLGRRRRKRVSAGVQAGADGALTGVRRSGGPGWAAYRRLCTSKARHRRIT